MEIEFDPDVDKTMTFSGKIDRYDDIQDILSLLELTGKVSFSLSGKQLKVAKGKPGSTYIKTNNQNG